MLPTELPAPPAAPAAHATSAAPASAVQPDTHLARYRQWLQTTHGLRFSSYDELWQWSVDELEAFWATIWDYFEVQSPTPYAQVLVERRMPGARWFEGAQVNYARQVFRHAEQAHAAGQPAIVHADESALDAGFGADTVHQLSWRELQRQVHALALALRAMGVQPGDRVGAVLPNAPQTVVAFLATVSLGAIWSVCSPDMGPVAILDRFSQIEPKVLIACDGYRFGGIAHDRRALLGQVLAGLPSLVAWVRWSRLNDLGAPVAGRGEAPGADPGEASVADPGEAPVADPGRRPVHDLQTLLAGSDAGYEPPWLAFDHPLWVVYSSGTTGLPKPIVHGHGGVIIEALKAGALHNDCGPSARTGDRVCWNASTTWIVWNGHVASLLSGTTLCLYEGNAGGRMVDGHGGRVAPDWTTLWRFVGASGATSFGAGSAFFAACQKAAIEPMAAADLRALRSLSATGSPLADDTFEWLWQHLPKRAGQPVWLNVISGGTDVAAAFVGGVPGLPVVAGEMQGRCLGVAAAAWGEPGADGLGLPLIDAVGELVITQPMPSMPLYFWNDREASPPGADGAGPPGGEVPDLGRPGVGRGSRYHESYFDMYPGIWRHGDWMRIVPHPELGSSAAIIYGRSDATINRHGIRMGTAELYRAVDAMAEVMDSLVVDLEYLGRPSWMPLFVVLREGLSLDAALTAQLKLAVRQALSPRHVPDDIYQVSAIPRTLSGKKMELPVKKLLMGADAASVLKRDAMANADSIDWFIDLARQRAAPSQPTQEPAA